MSGVWRRIVAAAVVVLAASAGCGLLPDNDRSEDTPAAKAADDETAPPAMPDGGEGGTLNTDEERITDLESRIRAQVDARPRTTGTEVASVAAEGAVLIALASLVALLASAFRFHRVGLALTLSVLGLLIAIAAFVNSAT